MLLTDVFDLLKLQPKPLEHYSKYALTLTFPILLVITLALGFCISAPEVSINVNIAFNLIFMFIGYLCLTLFLKYWLERKKKIFTLKALFNIFVLTTVVGWLFVPLAILDDTSNVFVYLNLVFLAYSFIILIFAIARGAKVSFGYAIAGVSIALLYASLISLGLLMMLPVPIG